MVIIFKKKKQEKKAAANCTFFLGQEIWLRKSWKQSGYYNFLHSFPNCLA